MPRPSQQSGPGPTGTGSVPPQSSKPVWLVKVVEAVAHARVAGLKSDARMSRLDSALVLCEVAESMLTKANPAAQVNELHSNSSLLIFSKIALMPLSVGDDPTALRTTFEKGLCHLKLSNFAHNAFGALRKAVKHIQALIAELKPVATPLRSSLLEFLALTLDSTLRHHPYYNAYLVRRDAFLDLANDAHSTASRLFFSTASSPSEARSIIDSVEASLSVAVELEDRFKIPNHVRKPAALLQEDFDIFRSTLAASQAILRGDADVVRASTYQTKANKLRGPEKARALGAIVGHAWLAFDAYRLAQKLAEESDLEIEAAACGKRGLLLREILGQTDAGHKLIVQAIKLTAAASSRIPTSEWYAACIRAAQDYRDRFARAEALGTEKQKRSILDVLEPALDKLRKRAEECKKEPTPDVIESFLDHLFTTHVPKVLNAKVQSGSSLRMMIMKAVAVYHPDKNGSFDEEWKVLAEEITKILNEINEWVKAT